MAQDKMLSVLEAGAIDVPDAIPDWYTNTVEAVNAGRAYLTTHPTCEGFIVRKVFNGGHYRTLVVQHRS